MLLTEYLPTSVPCGPRGLCSLGKCGGILAALSKTGGRAVLRAVTHHPAEPGLQDLWYLHARGNVRAEDLISMLHLATTE